MEIEDRLYSSTGVSEILGVSLRSVYRYLEDGKIKADVKTATGRHRFSKQNILDFLYPSQRVPSRQSLSDVQFSPGRRALKKDEDAIKQPVSEVDWLARFRAAQEKHTTETTLDKPSSDVSTPVAHSNIMSSQSAEPSKPVETVDWLAKFKEAREKLAEKPAEVTETPSETSSEAPSSPQTAASGASLADQYDFSSKFGKLRETAPKFQATQRMADKPTVQSISEEPKETPVVKEPPAAKEELPEEGLGFYYYTSGLPGLKEIANALHKSAVNSNVPYAFTMYAGMSLYKTIRPFSILHAYIKPEHKAFFEKVLQLAPANKNLAQLCLIVTNDSFIFDTLKEMHGLKVVSTIRLKKDLAEAGEDQYASEL